MPYWHHEILGLKFMGFSVTLKRPWNAIFMGISWLLGHFTQYFMGREYGNFHRFFMGFFRSFSWHWDHENVIDLTMKILWKICEFTMNYFTRFSWVLSSSWYWDIYPEKSTIIPYIRQIMIHSTSSNFSIFSIFLLCHCSEYFGYCWFEHAWFSTHKILLLIVACLQILCSSIDI